MDIMAQTEVSVALSSPKCWPETMFLILFFGLICFCFILEHVAAGFISSVEFVPYRKLQNGHLIYKKSAEPVW